MILWRWKNGDAEWEAFRMPDENPFQLAPRVLLFPLDRGTCGLLADGPVTINGVAALSFRILEDRDEIRVGDEILYFSTEGPAEVVPFPDQEAQVLCGRCKGEMRGGEAPVRCPGCGAWHHETAKLSCWTYDETCSSCGRPTAGFSWQPEPRASPARQVCGGDHV